MKITSIGYSYERFRITEHESSRKYHTNDTSDTIYKNEINNLNFECLILASNEILPLYLITNCEIIELHLYALINMSKENFEILFEFEKNGTKIIFNREGYQVWFTAEKRMKTIDTIINE